jgi:hypothetical protein
MQNSKDELKKTNRSYFRMNAILVIAILLTFGIGFISACNDPDTTRRMPSEESWDKNFSVPGPPAVNEQDTIEMFADSVVEKSKVK